MQLTDKSAQVDRSPMTLGEKIYIPSIWKGLKVTAKHFFKKKVTYNHPEERKPFSPYYRGLHVLNRDDDGREKCVACGLCALACPAEAITMEAAERKPGEENLYAEEKYAAKYEINMLRCIFCGLCEEACPKDAIYLTQTSAPPNYSRDYFIYKKEDLLITDEQIEERKKRKAAEAAAKQNEEA